MTLEDGLVDGGGSCRLEHAKEVGSAPSHRLVGGGGHDLDQGAHHQILELGDRVWALADQLLDDGFRVICVE